MKPKIQAISALQDNYIWAVVDELQKRVLIVDPGEASPVFLFLKEQQLSLVGILITHHHWDHTNGIAELLAEFPVPVWGSQKEKITGLTHPLHEGARVVIEDFPLSFEILEIPGHTLGHLAYYSPGILFCGDTLFAAGCGRLFEGKAEQLFNSLQKMASYPLDTQIYCAHEYTLKNLQFAKLVEPENLLIPKRIEKVEALRTEGLPSLPSRLSEEKETNPFLRCQQPTVRQSVERYAGQALATPLEVFTGLRKWKDSF